MTSEGEWQAEGAGVITDAGKIVRVPFPRVLETWFAIDRSVVVDALASPTLCLPRQAAMVSAYWVRRTALAQTMGEWRSVYRSWRELCPHGLLLGPHLWDLDDPDQVEWNDPPMPLPDDAVFSVESGGPYDYSDGPGYTIQMQLAQDAWIPKEWAESIGEPDREFGIDYEPADRVYPHLAQLMDLLAEEGIQVVEDGEVTTAVWDPFVTASSELIAWTPTRVDEFGNPIHSS